MELYIILVFFALAFDGTLYWTKYKMYYRILHSCKYTRFHYVSALEHLLYKIQTISRKIPFLLIRLNKYDINDVKGEVTCALWKREKILIVLEYIVNLLRKIFGIRIIYIICLMIYVFRKYEGQITSTIRVVSSKLIEVDYIYLFQSIYEYLLKNGSGILVALIIILAIYIHHLRDRNSRYIIEKIWDDDILISNKEVAMAQKNIKKHIIELYKSLTKNMWELKKVIDKMDRWNKYLNDKSLVIDTEQFIEYENIVQDIKQEIKRIEDHEGMSLYLKFNQEMWWQLYQLSLTNSDNKYYYGKEISECDKLSLEGILKEDAINKGNYRDTRELLMMYWVDAIASLNGMARYLKYIKERELKFAKINRRLSRVGLIKETFENIKSSSE